MKIKKLTAILASVSTLTLSSCGFSARALFSSENNPDSFYKTIKYRTTDPAVHFNGQTEVTFKTNRPFYTISRPEAVKDGFVLSCWTTIENDVSTKVKSTSNINSDLILYPYFIEATVLKDVIYSAIEEAGNTVLYLWNKDSSSSDSICPADPTSMSANITGIKVTSSGRSSVTVPRASFNYPVSFGTDIHSIPNNFLYGASGFDSEVTIPDWVTSIGNNFLYNCTNYNKQIIIPTAILTIGTNFLYNCNSFNKDLILNSTLTSIGEGFLVENKAFTSKITIDCPVSAFQGDINNSLYASSTEDNLYKVGYLVDGTNATDWWSHHYVDIADSTNNKYRRRQSVRFTTKSLTVNSRIPEITDEYSFDLYYDDISSWESTFNVIMHINRKTATLQHGAIIMNTFSISDESGQTFSATEAGELGRFDYDSEYTLLTIKLRDNDGKLLTPRGDLNISVDLTLATTQHTIKGEHNLDASKDSYKFVVDTTENENVRWSVTPSTAGSISVEGVFTPSAEFKANGGSAIIDAKQESPIPAWTAPSFEVEMSNLGKLNVSKITSSNDYQVKKANDTISGKVVVPKRYWDTSLGAWASVTTIEENGFAGCTGVDEISLFSDNAEGASLCNITDFKSNAFKGCTGLTSFVIPNDTTMGSNVFDGCSSLTTLDLTKWTSIPTQTGSNAFVGMVNAGVVKYKSFAADYNDIDKWRTNYPVRKYFKDNGLTVWSDSKWHFEHDEHAELLKVESNVVTGYSLPNATASTEWTDQEKYNLAVDKYGKATIRIPKEATSIKPNCFITDSLASTIPSTLHELSFEAGSNLTTIDEKAFYNATNLTSIDFANANNLTTINSHAFAYSGLTKLSLPQSLTTIADGAFYKAQLKSIVFPLFAKPVTFGSGAFAGNEQLALINVAAYDSLSAWQDKVTADETAFDGCAEAGVIKVKSEAVANDFLMWFMSHSITIIFTGKWVAQV